jgi:hypothetical protein
MVHASGKVVDVGVGVERSASAWWDFLSAAFVHDGVCSCGDSLERNDAGSSWRCRPSEVRSAMGGRSKVWYRLVTAMQCHLQLTLCRLTGR